MAGVNFSNRTILIVENLSLISELLNDYSVASDHTHNLFLVLGDVLFHHSELLRSNTVGNKRLLNISIR